MCFILMVMYLVGPSADLLVWLVFTVCLGCRFGVFLRGGWVWLVFCALYLVLVLVWFWVFRFGLLWSGGLCA